MRSKVTIVLLFLNVVLFFYIFQYEKVTLPDAHGRRVFGSEISTITALTRTMANAPTVRLALDPAKGNTWWLTQPYDWPADPSAVPSILSELQFLEHETSFPVADLAQSGQTLAEFGLAEPTTLLTFDSAGKTYTVKLGKETEVGNRLYLLSTDETRIHVVKRTFADAVKKPLDQLRAANVFTIPVFEVRSLNVQTGAPSNLKVRLRRDASNRWDFESPILARASKTNVEVAVNSLNSLTARRFLEPRETDLQRDGLNTPSLRITLEGNARRETLFIGNEVPPAPNAKPSADREFFAKVEDKNVVFTTTIPAKLLSDLRTSQETLRDPRVMEFEPETVTAITLTVPGQPDLSLQRLDPTPGTPAAWQVVARVTGQAPVTSPADSAIVTQLLNSLYQLSARKFLSDAPSDADVESYGFNRPEREITLSLNTGGGASGNDPTVLVLQVGISPDQPGRAYARAGKAPFIYEILPDILDATPATPRFYRERILREVPASARVTAVRLAEFPGGTILASASNDTDLTAETIATSSLSEPQRAALTALVGQLRKLRAKNFVSDTFNEQQADTPQGPRPWKFKLEVDLALPGGANAAQTATSTLYLTERLAGSTMLAGTTEFGGVVFELPQAMIDALFALVYTPRNDPGALPPASPTTTTTGPAPDAAAPAVQPTTAPAPAAPTPAKP